MANESARIVHDEVIGIMREIALRPSAAYCVSWDKQKQKIGLKEPVSSQANIRVDLEVRLKIKNGL